MTVDGTKQVVTPTGSGVVGVGLADGKLLWQVGFGGAKYQSNFGTPIVDGQTVIYPRSSAGTAALKIEKKGDRLHRHGGVEEEARAATSTTRRC